MSRRGGEADAGDRAPRTCEACGRQIQWRRKWERDWNRVKYCSASCRRRGVRPEDEALERAITELLAARPAGATICPSEAARLAARTATGGRRGSEAGSWRDPAGAGGLETRGGSGGSGGPGGPPDEADWRPLMEPARRAARRLVERGEVVITQRGRIVDPSTARGPIRIRRA